MTFPYCGKRTSTTNFCGLARGHAGSCYPPERTYTEAEMAERVAQRDLKWASHLGYDVSLGMTPIETEEDWNVVICEAPKVFEKVEYELCKTFDALVDAAFDKRDEAIIAYLKDGGYPLGKRILDALQAHDTELRAKWEAKREAKR